MNMRVVNGKEFEDRVSSMLDVIRDSGDVLEFSGNGSKSVFVFETEREEFLALFEDLEVFQSLREGVEDIEAGRYRPAEEVLDELRRT